MRFHGRYGFIILGFLCSGACAADTIDTFRFTASAGAEISGSVVFSVPGDGSSAGISDVISADATSTPITYFVRDSAGREVAVLVPATTYSLDSLKSFRYTSGTQGACFGSPNLTPGVVCTSINLFLGNLQEPNLNLLVEFAPRYVQTAATFTPVPNNPGFHGGVPFFTLTVADVPESTPFSSCALLAACALYHRLRRSLRH